MNKLSEEELLEWFKENIDRHAFLQISHPHLAYYATERDKQAYQQIREMIQKPGVDKRKLRIKPERMDHLEIGSSIGKPREAPKVTEKFMGEKAIEIYNYLYYETFNLNQVNDFIRSLVKEIAEKINLKGGKIEKRH